MNVQRTLMNESLLEDENFRDSTYILIIQIKAFLNPQTNITNLKNIFEFLFFVFYILEFKTK